MEVEKIRISCPGTSGRAILSKSSMRSPRRRSISPGAGRGMGLPFSHPLRLLRANVSASKALRKLIEIVWHVSDALQDCRLADLAGFGVHFDRESDSASLARCHEPGSLLGSVIGRGLDPGGGNELLSLQLERLHHVHGFRRHWAAPQSRRVAAIAPPRM